MRSTTSQRPEVLDHNLSGTCGPWRLWSVLHALKDLYTISPGCRGSTSIWLVSAMVTDMWHMSTSIWLVSAMVTDMWHMSTSIWLVSAMVTDMWHMITDFPPNLPKWEHTFHLRPFPRLQYRCCNFTNLWCFKISVVSRWSRSWSVRSGLNFGFRGCCHYQSRYFSR